MIDINAQIRLGVEQALDRLNVWSHQGGDGHAYIQDLIKDCSNPTSPGDVSTMLADCLVEIVNLRARSGIATMTGKLRRMIFDIIRDSKSEGSVVVFDLEGLLEPVVQALWRLDYAAHVEFTGQPDSDCAAPTGNDADGGQQS